MVVRTGVPASALAVIPPVFSPNGDGRDDAVSFAFRLARSAQISIDVKRSSRVVATVFSGVATVGDQSTTWDGRLPSGPIADGTYSAAVTVVSPFGTTTRALPLRVDTVAPRIRVVSFRRLIFRISEPASVTVIADGRRYLRSVRAGVFSLHIGRLARRVAISALDGAGNVSRTLRFP